MSDNSDSVGLPQIQRRTGDTVFGAICLLGSLVLFSQMWSQTAWVNGQGFAAQPGFWPSLAVSGMVLFSAINLALSFRDPSSEERLISLGEEISLWLRSIEFALWFMAYVLITPYVGYLPASLIFTVALTARCGYRSPQAFVAAALTALATVVLFKSFLQVRIPGGALYESLPGAIRNFFILYL